MINRPDNPSISLADTFRNRGGGRKAAPCTVAFLLTDSVRKLFFSSASVEAPEGAIFRWLSPSAQDSARFFDELALAKPRIVVTAWDTPPLSQEYIDRALPQLEYICNVTGTVRTVVPRGFIEEGGLVSNWGTSISNTVAEHALLLILACLRQVSRWKKVFAGDFLKNSRRLETRTLFGRRVGIHGFGGVARNLVSLLKPFGCEITAYSKGVPASLFCSLAVKQAGSLQQLFSESEILVECEALTAATQGSVTKGLLECLPADAVFVNVGRAKVVEQDALLALAAQGRLHVGLDVFDQEPAPDSPLFALPNVVVSPYLGGPTNDCLHICGELALRNVAKYLRGEAIPEIVTLAMYDRAT